MKAEVIIRPEAIIPSICDAMAIIEETGATCKTLLLSPDSFKILQKELEIKYFISSKVAHEYVGLIFGMLVYLDPKMSNNSLMVFDDDWKMSPYKSLGFYPNVANYMPITVPKNSVRYKFSRYDIAKGIIEPINYCLTCLEYNAACEHPVCDRHGCKNWVESL